MSSILILKPENGIIYPTSRALMKKLLLQNVSYFYQIFYKLISKTGIELFEQEMELFHLLLGLISKDFFHKMFLILIKEFKINFQNRKWNYPTRKWNYLSNFQAFDKKKRCFLFDPKVWKFIFKSWTNLARMGSICSICRKVKW